MEKQIEEMASDLENHTCMSRYQAEIASRMLYVKGYRKASEVAREIFEEIDDFQRTLRHIFLGMCDGNDYNTLNLLQIDSAIEALFDSRIAELKKKYTESEKGNDR
jgi:hypothetical protein